MKWIRNTPIWVWSICAFFAFAQPATHLLITYCAPDNAVPTGLQKPDSVIFIHAMRMFSNGFYSPYATCQSPFGDHSPRLFAVPFYVLYGLAGLLGHLLRLSDFLMLGIMNGLCGFVYLLVAYHFMRFVLPARANLGFALYAFAGGVGGVLYAGAAICGATHDEFFSRWFYRFAIYELVEGSNFAPYLLMPRLYYTLPLAAGLAGLAMCLSAWNAGNRLRFEAGALLLALCAVLNARIGPPLWGIGVLYAMQHAQRPFRVSLTLALPIVSGILLATMFMMSSPVFFSNYTAIVRQGMWFTSFITATLPLLLAASPVVARDMRTLSRFPGVIGYGALSFLIAFAVLFAAHQMYYGNLLTSSDHAAAVRLSDVALLAAIPAIGFAWRRKPSSPSAPHAWLIVWFVSYTALAVAAFGQGWFLQFSPQRLLTFLGIPLSLLAAESIGSVSLSRSMLARIVVFICVACGILSFLVSSLVFQGPFGMRPGIAANLGMNTAYMTHADHSVLDDLGPGIVAAPPPFNDILSLRSGSRVLGGFGSAGLSDQGSALLDSSVERFFAVGTPEDERRAFLNAWCVSYVFLPLGLKDSTVLDAEFAGMRDLVRVGAGGGASLFARRQ